MQKSSLFSKLALAATLLAFGVVVLGAYVRLSDAGLGCPDWPGCYGKLIVQEHEQAVREAAHAYPERPLEAHKAWKEMVHRYFAGTLGLLILLLAAIALRNRRDPGQPVALPLVLLGLVIFQALLGMWTVTLLLYPAVVMAHLLGGLATLALLWWLTARQWRWLDTAARGADRAWRPWAAIALLTVIAQIALGGWTSANYAALACPDFPTCLGSWWPTMDFGDGFTLLRRLGIDYEGGGELDHTARVAIHLVHRVGAVLSLLVIGGLGLMLLLKGSGAGLRGLGGLLLVVLGVQLSLGIANVLAALPLPVATAHNGVAALLLLTLVSINMALAYAPGRE
jgi:cytochrome c oxidase assembly protein subunit 15